MPRSPPHFAAALHRRNTRTPADVCRTHEYRSPYGHSAGLTAPPAHTLPLLRGSVCLQVDFYRRVVFRRGLVKRGAFIEDRIGNEMLGALRTVGASSALRYGCWIHDDGLRVPMVKHNHGRAFITHGEKRGIEERAAAGRASRSRSSSSSVDGEDGVAVAAMSRLFGGVTLQDGPSKQEGGVVGANGENIGGAGW